MSIRSKLGVQKSQTSLLPPSSKLGLFKQTKSDIDGIEPEQEAVQN